MQVADTDDSMMFRVGKNKAKQLHAILTEMDSHDSYYGEMLSHFKAGKWKGKGIHALETRTGDHIFVIFATSFITVILQKREGWEAFHDRMIEAVPLMVLPSTLTIF